MVNLLDVKCSDIDIGVRRRNLILGTIFFALVIRLMYLVQTLTLVRRRNLISGTILFALAIPVLSNSVNVLDNVQSLTLSYDLRTQYVLRLTDYYYVIKQMMREI